MIKLASFLTSFQIVVAGLLVFSIYRYIEVMTLFYRYLPLSPTLKLPASALVAFIVVSSLMIFSTHLNEFKLHKYDTGIWIKRVMFCFTLFINLFFWQAWSHNGASTNTNAALTISFKAIIVVFFAIFDYAYNHLFIKLWFQRNDQTNHELAKEKLQRKLSELEQAISEKSAVLSNILARDDPKVCPRCGKTFETPNHRNGHLRICKLSLNHN